MRQPDLLLAQTGGQINLFDPDLHEGDGGEVPFPLGQESAAKDFVGDLRTRDVVLHPGGKLLLGGAGGFSWQWLPFRLLRLLRLLAQKLGDKGEGGVGGLSEFVLIAEELQLLLRSGGPYVE